MDTMATGPQQSRVAIWLQPPESHPVGRRIQSLIEALGQEYSAPRFDAHATLLSGIALSEERTLEDVQELTRELAASLEVFEVCAPPESLTYFNTWNQSVLFLLEESEELVQAHVSAIRCFRGEDAAANGPSWAPPSRKPHVSLVYGNHEDEARDTMQSWVRAQAEVAGLAEAGFSFPVQELSLWTTDGGLAGVPTWSNVGTFPLGGR